MQARMVARCCLDQPPRMVACCCLDQPPRKELCIQRIHLGLSFAKDEEHKNEKSEKYEYVASWKKQKLVDSHLHPNMSSTARASSSLPSLVSTTLLSHDLPIQSGTSDILMWIVCPCAVQEMATVGTVTKLPSPISR